MNAAINRKKRREFAWRGIHAFIVSLCLVTCDANAQSFSANARAVRFVTDIVINDFHTAQAGGGYVFSYDRQETDATVEAKLARWFSGQAPQAIGMNSAEKQTLFGFYWAASMMTAASECFVDLARRACGEELSGWMTREMNDDPRFLRAYESAMKPLGLPPLLPNAH